MPTPDIRARAAEQQAALVQAVVGRGVAPVGFDEQGIEVMARSLRHKRLRTVARAWPALEQALGQDEYRGLFLDYARQRPLPASAMPGDDAIQFLRWLRDSGPVPDAVRLLIPQRWPLRVIRLRESRRVVISIRLPWLGTLRL
jgi:hypothetical protein